MSNKIFSSIEKLPVELIYRIFDNLEAETLFFSVRPLCRLFRSVVNTYDRYVLDFNLISKANFHIICRLNNPQNVISLTLSNDNRTSNQIALFISFDYLQQFTQLRSLTLIDIDELQLQFILQRINSKFLTSFSFGIREDNERLSKLVWPSNSTIQYLTINEDISIDDLLTIFECSPHLHTLVMSELPTEITNNLTTKYFRQLLSLTIKGLCRTVNELESFLLMTPLLVYLKLKHGANMLDGKRWEEFITRNLPQLRKFEFYFDEWRSTRQTQEDLELIISSFQTPFWIEYKKWFVKCEYDLSSTSMIILYSIPKCWSYLIYKPNLSSISLSTYPMRVHNDPLLMNNVSSFYLTLNKSLADDIQEKKTTTTTNHPLFPKVTEIDLAFQDDWPLLSLQTLSIFIDMSRIVRMTIHSNCFDEYNENIWIDLGIFNAQAHNLFDLFIQSNSDVYHSDRTIENISLILPRHVKHLQILLNNLEQINMVLGRCEKLSTIEFLNNNKIFLEEVMNWFVENTINSTCRQSDGMVSVWLGKKTI